MNFVTISGVISSDINFMKNTNNKTFTKWILSINDETKITNIECRCSETVGRVLFRKAKKGDIISCTGKLATKTDKDGFILDTVVLVERIDYFRAIDRSYENMTTDEFLNIFSPSVIANNIKKAKKGKKYGNKS